MPRSFVPRASLALAALALLGGASTLRAQALGTAQAYGVLGASTVTNTGPTTVTGNVGVSPGSSLTTTNGLTVIDGSIHQADADAAQAQQDAASAYSIFAGLPMTSNLTGLDLGGMTLTPGVYYFESSAQLTGNLFLNFLGNADAQFVFQIGSTLTTASSSAVIGLDGLFGPNVFFQVGKSATLGTTTAFRGSIIADQSVTLTTGATISCGRAIALNAAVTLDQNVISTVCAEQIPVTATPEPTTLALLLAPMVVVGFARRGRRK